MDNPISNIQRMILGIMIDCEYQTYSDLGVNLYLCEKRSASRYELKRAMYGLIQRGFAECHIGLKYNNGQFAGSGFTLNPDKLHEIKALIK